MSNTISCNDLKLLPYGLISEEITRAYNRNIERLKCSLAKNDFCDDLPGLLGAAVGQFYTIEEGTSAQLDFASSDFQFNYGTTEYSLDTNNLPLGVSATITLEGVVTVNVDTSIYVGEPLFEISHTITSSCGAQSTATSFIVVLALASPDSIYVPPIPDPPLEAYCCVEGVCIPERIVNDPRLNLVCDTNVRYVGGEACEGCGEPVFCCIDGEELQVMTRDECKSNFGEEYPFDKFGEAVNGCEDIWCCNEDLDINCEDVKRFECDSYDGESYPDEPQCTDVCETIYCCDPENGCYKSTEDGCHNLDREGSEFFDECVDICIGVWCCNGESCELVPIGECPTENIFETELECLDFCKKVWCCQPVNPFEPNSFECVETIKGKCFDEHRPTLGECEEKCGEDCCGCGNTEITSTNGERQGTSQTFIFGGQGSPCCGGSFPNFQYSAGAYCEEDDNGMVRLCVQALSATCEGPIAGGVTIASGNSANTQYSEWKDGCVGDEISLTVPLNYETVNQCTGNLSFSETFIMKISEC